MSKDRLRCLGMLKDVCGEHKKEIAGIIAALDEGIPSAILKSDFSIEISRRLLSRKLEDSRAIAEEVAIWAVDTWAIALGAVNESQLIQQLQAQGKSTGTAPQLPQPNASSYALGGEQTVQISQPQGVSPTRVYPDNTQTAHRPPNPSAPPQTPPQAQTTRSWLVSNRLAVASWLFFTTLATGLAILTVAVVREIIEPRVALEIKLMHHMPYHTARNLLLNSGWQIPRLPTAGYTKTHQKVISECSGSVELCNTYPEIEACSGQGFCRLNFFDHQGNTLIVVTYGDLLRVHHPHEARVTRWWLEK